MGKKSKYKRKSTKLNYLALFFLNLTVIFAAILLYHLFLNKPSIICANSKSCEESLKLKVENNAIGLFDNQKIVPPSIDLSQSDNQKPVLGAETEKGEKHIYVDLTNQTLTAYQGSAQIFKTYISSGKWFPTPIGDFTIWVKLRATRMTGGSGADYYDLPNVPYVMYFYNDKVPRFAGFSLHGAYWHNNFGHPMSHGCVNMRIIDAEKIYDWVDPQTNGNTTYADSKNQGTKITIFGEAPL